jgi:FKBP-type peptidyl-prolyl cis-trans isomerase FklB
MKKIALFAFTFSVAVTAVWAQAQQGTQPRPTVPPQIRSSGAGQTVPAQLAPVARTDQAGAGAGLLTPKQKTSYCVGLVAGADMVRHQLSTNDLDMDAVLRGIRDAVSSAKPAIDEDDMAQIMENLKQELSRRGEARKKAMEALGEKNKQLGETFLTANKLKDGVKSTQSGLQYRIVKSGNGITPAVGDKAMAHYRGTLLDGTEFDSSYKRNKPAEFTVGGLIPGFNEALQLMKVGDKWQIFVPAELAYGERGAPPDIAPNSTLIFDFELLDVKKDNGDAKGGYSQ